MKRHEHATPYARIRLAALDLDGTLLRRDMTLSDRSRRAIARVQRAGVEVVIASGRPYGSLPEEMTQLPGLHYAITSNGAAIHHLPDGARLYGSCLSPAAVARILAETAQRPVLLETYISGAAYAEARYVRDPARWGNPHPEYIWATRTPVADMRAFLQENQARLDGIAIVCLEQAEKRQLQEILERTVPDIYLTASCSQLLEIADRQAGKAAALRRVSQQLQLPLSQCAAFGNAENDSQMLAEAGLGVAVANAEPGCLAQADRIAPSNEEDGVAQVLEEITAAREAS